MGLRRPDQAHPAAQIPLSRSPAQLLQRRLPCTPGDQQRGLPPGSRQLLLCHSGHRCFRAKDLWGGAVRSATVAAVAAIAFAAMVLAPAAPAAYEEIGSGQTKLRIDPGFLTLLARHGVHLKGAEGARFGNGVASFPISDGKLDPTNGRGVINHDGALRFQAGGREILLRALMLRTTRPRAPLSAKLGGGQLKLGGRKPAVSQAGFAERIEVGEITLSPKVAGRLAKKLRLPGIFEAGQRLGSAVTTA